MGPNFLGVVGRVQCWLRSVLLQQPLTARCWRREATIPLCTLLLIVFLTMAAFYRGAVKVDNNFDRLLCKSGKSASRWRTLPPAISENQMRADLAEYLKPTGLLVCNKLLRLGGETVMFGPDNTTLSGDFIVCVDTDRQMSHQSCTVAVFTRCSDRSFARAASRFGCKTHTRPLCSEHEEDQSLDHLEEQGEEEEELSISDQLEQLELGSQEIGFMAVDVDGERTSELLDTLPDTVCQHVQQLGIVLDLSDYHLEQKEDGEEENRKEPQLSSSAVEQLYRRLRNLQRCGLKPFDVEDVEVEAAFRVRIEESSTTLSVIRVGFLRQLC